MQLTAQPFISLHEPHLSRRALAVSPPSYATPPSVELLYVDHHSWLKCWLQRRLGNASDAADLAHDVFMRLIVQPPRFETRPSARGYLRAMANGMCIDLWRRRSIEQAWLDTLVAQPDATVPSAEHQSIVLETLFEIDTLLRSLPLRAAQAFVMAVACDMTYREVAAELGVSVRMVAKYVASATLHCLRQETRQALGTLPQGSSALGEARSFIAES